MSETTSTELVPFDPYRAVWNARMGTALEAHDSQLTRDQAIQINDHFDIEVFLGTHGIADTTITKPTRVEYEEAASVIDRLEPGDTLFIEQLGFIEQPKELIDLNAIETPPDLDILNVFLLHTLRSMYEENKVFARAELERLRHAGKINAWHYAQDLATIKRVQIAYADYDAFDNEQMLTLSGHESVYQILVGSIDNGKDKSIEESLVVEDRSRKAVNIVKDYALAHLDAPEVSGRKPKLALLIGGDHGITLQDTFDRMYLRTETIELQESSIEERYIEHIVAPAMAALAVELVTRTRGITNTGGGVLGMIAPGLDAGQKGFQHLRAKRGALSRDRRFPATQRGGRISRLPRPSKEDLGPEDL